MDKKEMLVKLRELSDLISRYKQQYEYLDQGCARETVDQLEMVEEQAATMPGVPSVVNALPVFPVGKADFEKAKAETEESKKYTTIAMIATAVCVGWLLITKATLPAFLSIVAGVGWYFVNQTHKNNKQGLAKKEKAYQESVAQADASMEKFRKALSCYEQEVEDGIRTAKAFGHLYRETKAMHDNILAEYENKLDEARMECSRLIVLIGEHDYISEEYYHHVPKLISLLQSGRADSYKEALNMAIEEERQDAIEAARQQEEARRLEAMERQAEEDRRHNMMMERQQAAHDRAMERAEQDRVQAEKDRLKADERARNQAARKESDARQRASQQCMVCAKRSGCRNPYVPGCGAFVPKHY